MTDSRAALKLLPWAITAFFLWLSFDTSAQDRRIGSVEQIVWKLRRESGLF